MKQGDSRIRSSDLAGLDEFGHVAPRNPFDDAGLYEIGGALRPQSATPATQTTRRVSTIPGIGGSRSGDASAAPSASQISSSVSPAAAASASSLELTSQPQAPNRPRPARQVVHTVSIRSRSPMTTASATVCSRTTWCQNRWPSGAAIGDADVYLVLRAPPRLTFPDATVRTPAEVHLLSERFRGR